MASYCAWIPGTGAEAVILGMGADSESAHEDACGWALANGHDVSGGELVIGPISRDSR